ncbi:MAG: cadmium-translocating P-type ATPase [Clostridium sp.]|nr:cadmium-translocating P-type ATPase [Clostridium sp.]
MSENNNIKKNVKLEGLDCASCAIKIEDNLKNIKGIKNVNVDFVTKNLNIESDSSDYNRILSEAKKIIQKVEPDVRILEDNEKEKSNESSNEILKKQISTLIISSILFALGFFIIDNQNLKFVFYLASYIIVGHRVLISAFKNIINGQIFDENFLMSIATIGAFLIGQYSEGVAVMIFYQIGQIFENLAVGRSRKSISELMDISPEYANLKVNSTYKKVSPESLELGSEILVKPGEKFPIDGYVISGESRVDTSALTGESVPRKVISGDEVFAGFINQTGAVSVNVTKKYEDSTVSKILEMVENASSNKAPTEQLISKFAKIYTPIVVFLALAIALLPPLIISGEIFSNWIYRALVFLVISCPCALVISIPLGFFGGIGSASKKGILIKGGNFLEALNNIDSVVFDKTGTLTEGVFEVTDIRTFNNYTEEELVKSAAYIESNSNHPIAKSIKKYYGKEINLDKIESHTDLSGFGIKIKMDGDIFIAGNDKLMEKESVDYKINSDLGTIIYIAKNSEFMGSILISDKIKSDSKKLIKDLNRLGIENTIMLTGDRKDVGDSVGRELGIKEVFSELLPNEKVLKFEKIEKNKSKNKNVIFIGDGINDAPVLARADVGVSMGGLGSDAAIEASDIVLMTDEPSKLITAIKISKKTRKIVMQNIIFAFGVKFVVLALGAFGMATMWQAVFADVGVTVLAVLNSIRVLNNKNL